MRAFHVIRPDRRMRFVDGVMIEVGRRYVCDRGLFASTSVLALLWRAPAFMNGCLLTLVELGGEIVKLTAKVPKSVDAFLATERTVLAMLDLEETMDLRREITRALGRDPCAQTCEPQFVEDSKIADEIAFRTLTSHRSFTTTSASAPIILPGKTPTPIAGGA